MFSALDSRKKAILQRVIAEHIRTAEPVGSAWLVSRIHLGVSPATVRNELLELEASGFLSHPHTSAGRVPTEQGYRWFVDEVIGDVEPEKNDVREFAAVARGKDRAQAYREAAKRLSELSDGAIFLGLSAHSFFYTGLSHLFNQPEFADREMLANISAVIDHFDEVLDELFALAEESPRVFIGSDNPLGEKCGMVLVRLGSRTSPKIIGLFGPMRMDYGRSLALLQALRFIN